MAEGRAVGSTFAGRRIREKRNGKKERVKKEITKKGENKKRSSKKGRRQKRNSEKEKQNKTERRINAMEELFRELEQQLVCGREGMLATIIASSGSTPRGAGSRMLILPDGSIRGSIGGGAVEYQAVRMGLEAMKEKRSAVHGFSLTRNQAADIGMVCGGDVVVYFQYASPENTALICLCREIRKALGRDEDSWLVMDITEKTCWKMGLYTRKNGLVGMDWIREKCCDAERDDEAFAKVLFQKKAVQKEVFGRKYYCEPLVCAGTVYVFGGGHVAQELVPLLAHLNFRCVVMDDRKEFARPERFPQAAKTVVGDLEHIAERISIQPQDYVCIMTRGHQYDYYVQKQVMRAHPRYIGIMGSRNKAAVIREKLLQDGFCQEEVDACHTPIGIEIAAETPAEIAVSIAGELIKVRAGA